MKSVEIIVGASHENGFILFISNDGFIFDHMLCPILSFIMKILHVTKITLPRIINMKLSKNELECVVLITSNFLEITCACGPNLQ
jgi:hypothetical protein